MRRSRSRAPSLSESVAALLLSFASFVFAMLIYVDNRRLRRVEHRSAALSSTHTAGLLLGEAAGVIADVDRMLARSAIEMPADMRTRYEDVRRSVKADRERVARAMSEVAYGNLAVVEYREIAAQSSLVVYRVIAGRRDLLDVLLAVRASLTEPASACQPAESPRRGQPGPGRSPRDQPSDEPGGRESSASGGTSVATPSPSEAEAGGTLVGSPSAVTPG